MEQPLYRDMFCVYWDDGAEDAYWHANTQVQRATVRCLREAFQRWCKVANWYDGKKSLQGVGRNVYEWRASDKVGGYRVLVAEDNHSAYPRLLFLGVGDHAWVKKFVSKYAHSADLLGARAHPAVSSFSCDRVNPLFGDIEDSTDPTWAEELHGESWMWFLSEEQSRIADDVFGLVTSSTGSPSVSYLSGGAGTGKTAILLSLASRLRQQRIPVDFQCSTYLAKHLNSYAGVSMRAIKSSDPGAVLLVDDPEGPSTVQEAVARAKSQRRHLVLGFDPLQWTGKRLGQQMDNLPGARQFSLTTCYRQGENLARQAQDVVAKVNARSSWRADRQKIAAEREFLQAIEAQYLGRLELIKPGGRVKVVPPSSARAVLEQEASSVRQRWYNWEDLPNLLLLEDRFHGVHLGKQTRSLVSQIKRLEMPLDAVERYRGLEFQSVWIFMEEGFYDNVEKGRTGLSSAEWAQLRDLHIALTRAKDEMLIFLWKRQWT